MLLVVVKELNSFYVSDICRGNFNFKAVVMSAMGFDLQQQQQESDLIKKDRIGVPNNNIQGL